MDFKEIKRLIGIVEESKVSHFSIETEGVKIEIKKESAIPVQQVASIPIPAPAQPQAPTPSTETTAPADTDCEDDGLVPITSQMVGTFYDSPNPDAPPYIKVGDRVKSGQTVCIIEAMKLFNEIESEVSGTVEKICVNPSDPIEYGQTLFLVRVDG